MRNADPPEVREQRLVELRLAAEAALHSIGTMHSYKLPAWAYPTQDLLDIIGRTEEAQPEVIAPASLRMFSSGPDGFLWRCAEAWEADVSELCTINAELNTTIIRQQKRIKAVETLVDDALMFWGDDNPAASDELYSVMQRLAALREAQHE